MCTRESTERERKRGGRLVGKHEIGETRVFESDTFDERDGMEGAK
jgi:hypothetical protein